MIQDIEFEYKMNDDECKKWDLNLVRNINVRIQQHFTLIRLYTTVQYVIIDKRLKCII